MIAVGGDALVAVLGRRLEPDHDRFLPDVEVAETTDQAHAVELARLLLEAADQEHLAVECQKFVLGRVRLLCAARGHHRRIPPGFIIVQR
jgi:hypothetical protein